MPPPPKNLRLARRNLPSHVLSTARKWSLNLSPILNLNMKNRRNRKLPVCATYNNSCEQYLLTLITLVNVRGRGARRPRGGGVGRATRVAPRPGRGGRGGRATRAGRGAGTSPGRARKRLGKEPKSKTPPPPDPDLGKEPKSKTPPPTPPPDPEPESDIIISDAEESAPEYTGLH